MKNSDTLPRSKEVDQLLEQKTKREGKFWKKKWKPYNQMTYKDKQKLSDKEALKDHLKAVK